MVDINAVFFGARRAVDIPKNLSIDREKIIVFDLIWKINEFVRTDRMKQLSLEHN
jgi:hypothetical protein